MSVSPKQKVKQFLINKGLLPVTKFFVNLFSIRTTKTLFIGLRSYLFNNCLTYFPNHFIRIFYLKYILGIKIGKSTFIHMGARLDGDITIGDNSVIGRNCVLLGEITVGSNVSLTAETYIFTSSHIADSPTFACFYKPVIIEDYVWTGARSMIGPGIIIGKGAVLGAASLATKNIPAYTIYAGSPARKIGRRSELLEYKLNYFPFFQ